MIQLKLDNSLKTSAERINLVQKIVAENPSLSNRQLEWLSNYILEADIKQNKKQRELLTDNRMVTVNKREISFEGLTSKFEKEEDGVYNLITNDKNVLFTPKYCITETDIAKIPGLKELRKAIDSIEKQCKNAKGKRKSSLKKQLIEMRKDQYILKGMIHKPIKLQGFRNKSGYTYSIEEEYWWDDDQLPHNDKAFSLFDKKSISYLLSNYTKLKEDSWANFSDDMYYLLQDLDEIIEERLKVDNPYYYAILVWKIDKKSNLEIQKLLNEYFQINHTVEYISNIWKNKIPKLIAEKAQEKYLIWYYTFVEKGYWKKCSKCGEIKLAHTRFFSKNGTSKDGWYSQCKKCRNAKSKKNQQPIKILPKFL